MSTPAHPWMRRTVCALALVCLTGPAALAADRRYEIHLLEHSWTPPAGVPAQAEHALTALAGAAAASGAKSGARSEPTVHALVQLYEVPDDSQRNDLARSGLDLGEYVPGNAWIAAIPASRSATVARLPEVRWLEPWTAQHKLHPRLTAGDVAPWARSRDHPGWIMAMVLLHHDVDLARGAALAERAGGVAMPPLEGVHGMIIWLPEQALPTLAAEEDVLWIEEGPAPLTATNDGARSQMNVNLIVASPYDLDGKGVRLFVYDGGTVLATHDTFNDANGSRVTVIDNAPEFWHSTHVAGTAAGDGGGSPAGRGRGMAPGASILSAGYQWTDPGMIFLDTAGDIEADYATARKSFDADLGTNSIGSNTAGNGYPCSREGDYATSSALLDSIVRGNDAAVGSAVLMLWANGNERGGSFGACGVHYHTTAEPSCAKNPIQIGAVNSDGGAMTWFSSWGPCDDGRLKPVVSGPGCETGRVTGEAGIYSSYDTNNTSYNVFCGTSMATPAVAGAVALLFQDWRNHIPIIFPGNIPRIQPAMVKAVLVHTARDLGTDGPDYRTGYGAVDAKALIDFERTASQGLGSQGPAVWGTDSISNAQTDVYTVNVPNGIGELKATLAWDDAAAAPLAATALVNDLDLELVAPDNTVYHAWVLDPANPQAAATTGTNTLDNQEQVLVKNPAAGLWTVRVKGTSVPQGPQSYGLVYTATPRQVDAAACTAAASSFEIDNDGWTLNGATRSAAPGTGHGAFSLQLAGLNTIQTAGKPFTLPANSRSIWSFDLYMTTAEVGGMTSSGSDSLYAEVRDAGGLTPLAVLDGTTDHDLPGVWQARRNLDLTPWAGQTIQLFFRSSNGSANPTVFSVDDVQVTSCPLSSPVQQLTVTSKGSEDGDVIESTETSSVGGTVQAVNFSLYGPSDFWIGDNWQDQQARGFLSFDTSAIPDTAAILSARIVLYHDYGGLSQDAFASLGICQLDVKSGGLNNNTALEAVDFQAPVDHLKVSILSKSPAGGTSYATLNGDGLASINKTGTTQFKLYFQLGDNDNGLNDVAFFAAGEETLALRPKLEVTYLP